MDRGQPVQDRYEIETYRASNSTVELFDAVDRQLDRPVTLQIVHEALADDSNLASTFDKHQKIGLSLFHCSIAAIYDVGVHDGRAFSVMERLRPLVPADFRLRDDSPDLPAILKITRQVGEAVGCCREAGLVDWAFVPGCVGLDAEGNARVAIIEGPSSAASDAQGVADVAALGSFLRGFFESSEAFDASVLPSQVVTLLDSIEGRSGAGFTSAGEAASAIGLIEQAGNEPTQAYLPDVGPIGGLSTSAEAPTLASPIVNAIPAAEVGKMATQELTIAGLELPGTAAPMEQPEPEPERRGGFNSPVLIGVLGAVAAILLMFVVLPRLVDSRGELTTQSLIGPTPTTPPMVAAPDLKGMKLAEAQVLAGGYGLSVVSGAYAEDKALPPDTVLSQEPAVGTLVLSGSVITVSVNLVAEAQPPVPATAVPVVVPAQDVQPAAQDTDADAQKKDTDKGKAKGKDKGKDK